MEDVKFDGARLEALEREFRESGKDIDTFLRDRLRESGRPEVAESIIKTMADIDANYAEVRTCRESGSNLTDWFRGKLDDIRKAIKSKLPNTASWLGQFLRSILNLLKGSPDIKPESVEFIGPEADALTENLDAVLTERGLSDIMEESSKSEEK